MLSQPIALAIGKVKDLTRPFHQVKALLVKVQAANFTLSVSDQAQISKIDSILLNHRVRAITPPAPLKGVGFAFIKSL